MHQLSPMAGRRAYLGVLLGLGIMAVAAFSDPGTHPVIGGEPGRSVVPAGFASRTGTGSLSASAGFAAPATTNANGTPGTRCIRISSARFDARGIDRRNLNGEFLVIRNVCANATLLSGWKVHDSGKRNVYRFPSGFRLGAGERVLLKTGIGRARSANLYWGRRSEVWDNRSRERAYLVDPAGATVSIWPTPTPTPAPTATPVPTPTPTPTPAPTATSAFGSRPASGAINLSNCSNIVIENKTFKDLGAGVIAIRLSNCTNVTIRSVDFINVAEGVYAVNSSDIKVLDSRYSNIIGPHARTGANVANFVQFNNVNRAQIARNKGKGGDTEDIVSIYKSSYVTVEDNHFEGTNWTSPSGSGIALGDDGGTGNIARRNILVNPGQVGIFIAGGVNHQIVDNIIIGQQRTNSNVGVYVWNQYASACSGNTVSGNRVLWRRADGLLNPYWNAGNCGTVAGSGNAWIAPLVLALHRVVL